MVNYNNGKIYKIEPIVEHDEGEIYIGSTTKQYLSQRMDSHRLNYRKYVKSNGNPITCFTKIFDKYGIENCQIILLENVNATSRDELTAREAFYIKSMKCVNKYVPLRTRKEYVTETDYNKKYYEKNKNDILEKNKEYRLKNKEILAEKEKEKTTCICGCLIQKKKLLCHMRTKKHKLLMIELETKNI